LAVLGGLGAKLPASSRAEILSFDAKTAKNRQDRQEAERVSAAAAFRGTHQSLFEQLSD
jgi:hypothetical protein